MNEDSEDRDLSFESSFDYNVLKTATVYLIDGSKSMFTTKPISKESDDTAFVVALKCASKTLKSQIFGAPKDLFGVVLYGVPHDLSLPMGKPSQHSGVHILVDLAPADVDAILDIDKLLKDPELMGLRPKSDHSTSHPLQLAEGLWQCSKILESVKNISKHVLLFTAESDPHLERDQRKQAELRASDLMDAGGRVEVIGLSQDFNFLPFYKDLVAAPGTEESENLWKPPSNAQKLDALLNQVVTLSRTRRPRGKIDFNINDNFKVSVGLYSLVREAGMPRKVKLDRKTNDILTTVTSKYSAAADVENMSADLLMRSDVVKYQEFGGERIRLRIDEHRSLRRMGKPGLTLLGFKPRAMIEAHWYHRPCDFLYPEESVIKGSRLFIAALIDRCKAQDKVAICSIIANTNSLPALVALLPQEEIVDENGAQVAPPGFHVFYLPYADDVREVNLVELSGENQPEKANEEQIAVAKKLVRKLDQKGGYKPDLIQNPALRKLWVNIESMALDEEAEEFLDSTVVPSEIVEKRIGPLAEELNSLVEVEESKPKKVYKKPLLDGANGGVPSKKMKADGNTTDDVEVMIREGKGMKVTVPRLKDYLHLRNIKFSSKAKKDELLELATNVVKSE